ncbi:MAG: hypothetical protein R3B40_00645 [Polyangiales bacterium]
MPATTLRRALESYRRDEARARVGRFRGAARAPSEAEVILEHPLLSTDEALERLAEIEAQGMLAAAELRAMRAHVADIRAERVLAPTRAAWRSLSARVVERSGHGARVGDLVEELATPDAEVQRAQREAGVRALERVADEVAPRVAESELRARAVREGALVGDRWAGPASTAAEATTDLSALAQAWLAVTDDAAMELIERAARHEGLARPQRWDELARVLAFRAVRGSFGPRDRGRRVGAPLAVLGFGRELSSVRLEPPHPSVGVRARLAVLDSARDVRVSPAARELGAASELNLAEGVARALGQLLTPAALPFAQRVPVVDHAPRLLAALMQQALVDPVAAPRDRALARERPHHVTALLVLQLAAARTAAAAVALRAEDSPDAAEALSQRVFGVGLPRSLARLALSGERSHAARFLAHLQAFACWSLLRDALDEDWFRNPRAAELLRASMALSATGDARMGVPLPGLFERPLALSDVHVARDRVVELLG